MVTFEDIDAVIKTNRLNTLIGSYEIRQDKNEQMNMSKILELNQILGLSTGYPPKVLNAYLANASHFSLEKKVFLVQLLKIIGYQCSFELLQALRLIDFLKSQDVSLEYFYFLLDGLLTIDSIKNIDNEALICLTDGYIYPVFNAFQQLDLEEIDPTLRRNMCHAMTSEYLMQFPNLYGVYYYIPFQLAGHFEHSVLIDASKKMVYDLAQNASIPLEVWQKYYPSEAFAISGEEFQTLREKTFEKYGYKIDMSFLEEVRRIRKK